MTAVSLGEVGTGKTTKPASSFKRMTIGLWAILAKVGGKFFSVLIKLVKALKVGKLALAGGTFAGYALMFSWQFAVVIMAVLFVHEYGHIWAMKRCGLKVRGIYFLPFIGAAAVTDGEFGSRGKESFIALMGPVWGLGTAIVLYVAYLVTGMPLIAALAGWTALINVFNLLPINPLDGGRVWKSIAWSASSSVGLAVSFLMLGGVVVAAIILKLGLFVFLGVIALLELAFELRQFQANNERRNILEAFKGVTDIKKFESVMGDETKVFEEKANWIFHLPERVALKRIAVEKRKAHETMIRRRRFFFVGDEDGVTCDGLTEFFAKKMTIPSMSVGQSLASALGYVALSGILLAIMYACQHVPAAAAALQALT